MGWEATKDYSKKGALRFFAEIYLLFCYERLSFFVHMVGHFCFFFFLGKYSVMALIELFSSAILLVRYIFYYKLREKC